MTNGFYQYDKYIIIFNDNLKEKENESTLNEKLSTFSTVGLSQCETGLYYGDEIIKKI